VTLFFLDLLILTLFLLLQFLFMRLEELNIIINPVNFSYNLDGNYTGDPQGMKNWGYKSFVDFL